MQRSEFNYKAFDFVFFQNCIYIFKKFLEVAPSIFANESAGHQNGCLL